MALIVAPVDQLGGLTEPSGKMAFSMPTAEGTLFHPGAPMSTVRLPGQRGVIMANGYDPVRLLIDKTIYRVGILAPQNAPTITPTGVRATATLKLDTDGAGGLAEYVIANNDFLTIGIWSIKFKTALSALRPQKGYVPSEVIVGANNTATLANLAAFVNGDDGDGTLYWHHTEHSDNGVYKVSATSDATTCTLTFEDYGTSGNSTLAYLDINNASQGDGTVSNWSTNVDFGSNGAAIHTTTGTLTGGTDGSGSYPEAGLYRYFYTYFRTVDGAESGPSPVASAATGISMSIEVDGLVASVDTSVDMLKIYRTEDTGEEFFLLAEIERALASSPDYTDSTPNGEEDGSLQGFGNTSFDETLHRVYRFGYIPRVSHLAVWKGRVWGGGALLSADYSHGTAAVISGDPIITLSTGAVPSEDMIGNVYSDDNDTETYNIIAVDVAGRTIDIGRNYSGSTTGGTAYSIKDKRDPTQVYCSEPWAPNIWPPQNNPGGVDEDGDDEGITGFAPMDGALIVFSRTSMYRIAGDDLLSWQMHRVQGGVGCVAGNTIVQVKIAGSVGIMWLAPDGIYIYGGGSSAPESVSSRGDDEGIDGTIDRINEAHANLSHAHYDFRDRTVVFNVPLDDEVVPESTIVYDLSRRDFSGPDQTSPTTFTGTVIDVSGNRVQLSGDRFGGIWHESLGKSDGGYGGLDPVQALAAGGTVRVVTASAGAVFDSSGVGLRGTPAMILYADGSFAYTTIISNTTDELTFAYDLDTAPSQGDQVIVGAIHGRVRIGKVIAGDMYEFITWKDLLVLTSPETEGAYFVATSGDQSALTVPTEGDDLSGDFSTPTGRTIFKAQHRGMFQQFELNVLHPGIQAAFLGYALNLGTREI